MEDAWLLLPANGILSKTKQSAIIFGCFWKKLQLRLEAALRIVALIFPFFIFTAVEEPSKADGGWIGFHLI